MNEDKYIMREQLLIESDRLHKSLRFSQVKVLVELFVATVVIAFWWPTFAFRYEEPTYTTLLISIPPVINAMSWLFWISLAYMSLFRAIGPISRLHDAPPRHSLEQYDRIQYMLRRQKRIECLFDVLVGFQFLSIAIVPLLVMSRWLVA